MGYADNQPLATETIGRLRVRLYPDRLALGAGAAAEMAAAMRKALQRKPTIRVVFASAPSQNEFIDALAAISDIDWSRVTAFHMDEYVGLPPDASQLFGRYLSTRLFSRVDPGTVHLIDGTRPAANECARYTDLLRTAPIDIVCLGIGENGHIAFNDPPVAEFDDSETVKLVELDTASRQQQVNNGCFALLGDVPTHALTMTIPALLSGQELFCIVPGSTKRQAVAETLSGPITTDCPASVLRTHPSCTLYVDTQSYPDAP